MDDQRQKLQEAIKIIKECESYEYPTPAEERYYLNILINLAQSVLKGRLVEPMSERDIEIICIAEGQRIFEQGLTRACLYKALARVLVGHIGKKEARDV